MDTTRLTPPNLAAGGQAIPMAIVRASCWAGGEVLEKEVPKQTLWRRNLRWFCDDCEVSWSSPGEVVSSAA